MDRKTKKAVMVTLYISFITAPIGSLIMINFIEIPLFVGAFFGAILGLFLPWVIGLISYTVYAISNPLQGFENINKKE